MLFSKKGFKVFIYKSAIDMRCGFHKLTGFIRDTYTMQTLLDGNVFIFFGKNRHRLKILLFDGSGLILLTKRIEKGRFMSIQDCEYETVSVSELEQLLHGSVLKKGTLGQMPKSA